MSKYKVENVEAVECPYCKMETGESKLYQFIHWKHLKRFHSKTMDDLNIDFPEWITMTEKEMEKRNKKAILMKEAKKKKETETKKINCYYCKNEFDGNINLSNKFSVCPECKKKGLKNPKSQETIKKSFDTIKEKHGVNNVSELPEVIEKRRLTTKKNIEKNPNFYNEVTKKRQNTNKDNFGDNWSKEIHKLSKKGMKNKHGNKYALQVDKFMDKMIDTMIDRYDKDNAMKVDKFKEKLESTILRDYGKINIMQVDEFKEKAKQTNIRIRGVEYPTQSDDVKMKSSETQNRKMKEKIKPILERFGLELLDEYKHAHDKYRFKCHKCNEIFIRNWNDLDQRGYECPNCTPKNNFSPSKPELEIGEFVKSLGFDIHTSNRHLIAPWELDIVIHSKKIAIEHSGLAHHHETILEETRKKLKDPKKYHLMKKLMCDEKGYRLITIFGDEWLFKKEIVENRLKQILGVNDSKLVYARNCIVKIISPLDKNIFLDKFHLQGKDRSNIHLGLFSEDNLISVMTFSHGNISKGSKNIEDVWELNRFCSDYNYRVIGGAGKLLEYFKRNYNWKTIYSYADLRWSNGDVYHKLGFKTDGVARLNYWYVNLNRNIGRIHRYSLRKRPDEPKDIPERILRLSEGYKIIWDCGNLKFTLEK